MKTFCKKFLCLFLAILLTFSAFNIEQASAAATSGILLEKTGTAKANSPIRYRLTQTSASDIRFVLQCSIRTTVSIVIKDSELDTSLFSDILSSADPRWTYSQSTGIYEYIYTTNIAAGEYILELSFEKDTNYALSVSTVSKEPALNKTKLTLTKGFSSTLKVTNGKIKKCTSSNKSIASVTNKGKITAKKTGKATIKVTLTNGKTLSCKVTVKKNTYSRTKLTISDVSVNSYALKAYAASFDSKGNLVVKFTIANNGYGKLEKISSFKIMVKDSSKNTVASYRKSSYAISVNSYSAKDYKVMIPKGSLKKSASKIDLRTCTFSITGTDADAAF